jgi:hypothetical protein
MTVIVGAGAAGLMAAIFAAAGSQRVAVLERTSDGGRKILISGGGRCNVLPSAASPERFVSDSPHLMRRLLRSWPLREQRAFFETVLRIPLALEPETGKLFPRSNRARDVRDALVDHARRLGVELRFHTALTGLMPDASGWRLETTRGPLSASRVILATGGLSVPATGSDGGGLRTCAALGHTVQPAYPALTPLVADPPVHGNLSGISVTARIRAHGRSRVTESTGGFLFTHRGYSGPSVLDVSHIAVQSHEAGCDPAVLRVRWGDLDRTHWEAALGNGAGAVVNVIAQRLPHRLALALMADADVHVERRTSDLRRAERESLLSTLTSYVLPWTGHEGFKKAEVTGGGIRLDEVDPRTLESRRHAGLYLCGEMLDAFGPIGGHNFAWAWATGRLAGLGAAAKNGG